MATILKVKLAIAALAIVVLATIALLENKFFAPVTIKRWSELSWNDFQGIAKPLSSYAASISSELLLEYDSTLSRYVAYAAQNNIRSWKGSIRQDQSAYLLKHEQYHFNITNVHAQILNEYIKENPNATLRSYTLRLESIHIDNEQMQSRYDRETNHSLIDDKQRWWEYRIDSMMNEEPWVVDKPTGEKFFFPHPPESGLGYDNSMEYRFYYVQRYGMVLSVTIYEADTDDRFGLANQILKGTEDDFKTIKTFSVDTTQGFETSASSVDTAGRVFHERWIGEKYYLYQIRAVFSNQNADTTGYSQIAFSFINSFELQSRKK